jgi:hypothetical protein
MHSINWEMTPLMTAIVDALEKLDGVADERGLAHMASLSGENGRYGAKAHFAKGVRALEVRGILTIVVVERRYWCFTEQAWRDRGHTGPAPRPVQEAMF